MKKTISILLLTFSLLSLFGQNNLTATKASKNSFPTNVNSGNLNELAKLNGKVVAFDGIIERIEVSRNNTPFYKLKIDSINYLWTVLMFKNEKNHIGDTIRVVGYLSETSDGINEIEKKYLEGKFIVLSFGLVDFKNSNFLFLGGANQQKQEWVEGKIPS